MLSLEQIRMFVIAAEEGSFSACARKTGKVQSAVSHGINTLELDLNLELFDRSSRNPRLTPAGERLLRQARALLQQADELEKTAQAIDKEQETRFTIALDDGLLLPQVFTLLKQLEERFPTLELELLTLPSTDMAAAVRSGEVQLGVMFSEVEAVKTTDFCFVGQLEMIAVCHASYPLAALERISISTLLPYRQIAVRGKDKRESSLLLSIASKVWWCSGYSEALSLVERQLGWAYLPRFMVQHLLDNEQLHRMKLAIDHVTWSVPVDLIFSKGEPHGPVFSWLLDELKKLYASLARD